MDARHRYVANIVGDGLGVSQAKVDKIINASLPVLERFFDAGGPSHLFFVSPPKGANPDEVCSPPRRPALPHPPPLMRNPAPDRAAPAD